MAEVEAAALAFADAIRDKQAAEAKLRAAIQVANEKGQALAAMYEAAKASK